MTYTAFLSSLIMFSNLVVVAAQLQKADVKW